MWAFTIFVLCLDPADDAAATRPRLQRLAGRNAGDHEQGSAADPQAGLAREENQQKSVCGGVRGGVAVHERGGAVQHSNQSPLEINSFL